MSLQGYKPDEVPENEKYQQADDNSPLMKLFKDETDVQGLTSRNIHVKFWLLNDQYEALKKLNDEYIKRMILHREIIDALNIKNRAAYGFAALMTLILILMEFIK